MRPPDLTISLEHLRRLTDCSGVIQHANYALPDYRTGYTTDDNARALMVAVRHHRIYGDDLSRELATRYLAFLNYAQEEDGRFHNFIGYDRRFLEETESEDTFGHALSAVAHLLHSPPYSGLTGAAERIFHLALPHVGDLEHPRGRALSVIALYWWAKARPTEAPRANQMIRPLADYLLARFNEHSRPDWRWLLPEMTYGNAKLPEALFRAYQMTGDAGYLKVARTSFDFLSEKAFPGEVLCLVGNHGWYRQSDEEPPLYDQQPIDAAAMVEAALAAFEATNEADYLRRAQLALEWFFGRNIRGESLYDPETGGCFDGLMDTGVNRNCGAESTICLLLAHLSMLDTLREVSWAAGTARPSALSASLATPANPARKAIIQRHPGP